MLENQIFYHGITRKIIVSFGSLFSDVKVVRENTDATQSKTIAVPISYAPKEKWLVRIEQDPDLNNHTYISLPRMSFEITGMAYDPSRKMNRNSLITCGDANGVTRMFSPVPYNIDISLYVISKTQEDCLQIVEQILPYFSPDFAMSIKVVPESNVIVDVPIILNSVSIQDDYDGDFQTRRFVTYTLTFTLKSMFFGPASQGKIITNVSVDTSNIETLEKIMNYSLEGDETTGQIVSEVFTEN